MFYLVILSAILGKVYGGIQPKIIGGSEVTSLKDFKFIASIRSAKSERQGFGSGHICGGSLIASAQVLTAAHCLVKIDAETNERTVKRASEIVVVFATLDRTRKTKNTIVSKVKEFYYHKNFNYTLENDIAYLVLEKSLILSEIIGPIDITNRNVYVGENCIVAGWGRTTDDKSDPSKVLMEAEINIVDSSQCYAGQDILHPGMICAKALGKDSCQGDSGGPLICHNQLAGLVSWGYQCGNRNYPGVYTDVYKYNNFSAIPWRKSGSNGTFITWYLLIVSMFF